MYLLLGTAQGLSSSRAQGSRLGTVLNPIQFNQWYIG